MKKILFTGGTGFIGKNVLPFLKNKYEIVAPARQDLELRDTEAVYQYIRKGQFDVILHSANPNPVKNSMADEQAKMFEDSMRVFMNLYRLRDDYGKLVYLGSGAELDKGKDLCRVKEEEIGQTLPADMYGFSKYLMNELAKQADNVYNMRLFACYGPYDHESKFITHVIRCCIKIQEVTIRQNCYFDYMHVYDFAKIIDWFIDNTPKYKDYNICSGSRYSLLEIAQKVCYQMGNDKPVRLLSGGLNREYTADNSRLLNEMKNMKFISIDEGIAMQIKWEKEHFKL